MSFARHRWTLAGIATLGAASLAGLAGCGEPDSAKVATPVHESADAHADEPAHAGPGELRLDPTMLRDLRLTEAAVQARPGSEATAALGELTVVPDRQAEVSPPVAARVARLVAAPGDRVESGQPLVELESVELGRARSAWLAADARLTLARSALERTRVLERERIASTQAVQQAEAEAATAEAEAAAARAALAAFGLSDADAAEIARFPLVAPLGGTVLESRAVLGRSVEAGEMLFRIADTSRLWLVAHVYERDALRVRPGALARVVLPARPGETLSGRVVRIGGEVEQASRTVEVRVELDNAEGRLLPGLSGTAWLPLGEEDAEVLAVPAAAVQRLASEWCVFLPREEGLFEVRVIGRGRDLGGDVEVIHGLQAGETVVVDGAFLLKSQAEREQGGGGGGHDH